MNDKKTYFGVGFLSVALVAAAITISTLYNKESNVTSNTVISETTNNNIDNENTNNDETVDNTTNNDESSKTDDSSTTEEKKEETVEETVEEDSSEVEEDPKKDKNPSFDIDDDPTSEEKKEEEEAPVDPSEIEEKEEEKEEEIEEEKEEPLDPKMFRITETIKDDNSSFKYGAYYLKYETELDDSEDISYSINYKNGGEVASGILTISFDKVNHIITVGINNVFTNQIEINFYSESNSFTEDTVSLDFNEQVELKTSFICETNKPLSFTSEVNTTGGSVTYNKKLGSSSVTWNQNFVSTVQNRLQYSFYSVLENYKNNYYYISDFKYTLYGLSQNDLNKLQTNKFNFNTFYNSIYIKANYVLVYETEDDFDIQEIEEYYHLDQVTNKGYDLFNGTNKIFDYSVTFNDKEYNYSFGINKDDIKSQYRIEDHQTLYANN